MTQVALQGSATSGKWSSSATPTINTPAGSAGHVQILVASWDAGSTVSAPSFSGWTLKDETFQSGTANRKAWYARTLSSDVSAGTVSPTFSAAVYGIYWAGSFNGALQADAGLAQLVTWTNPQVVAATSSPITGSLHLVAMSSANWPRSVTTVTGYTEVYDDYEYTATQGIWLAVNCKDVGEGAVASSSWSLYDETGGSSASDQANYLSAVLVPLAQDVALTGAAATASAGTLSPQASYSAAITGGQVAASAGTMTPVAGFSAALTGDAASATAGAAGYTVAVALAGETVSASVGTLSRVASRTLAGSAASASVGAAVASRGAALSGAVASAAAGSAGRDAAVAVPGAVASAVAGTIAAESVGNVTRALVGSELTTSAGAAVSITSTTVAGSGVAVAAGALTVQIGADATAELSGNLHPVNRVPRYSVRLGGRMVYADSAHALQAAIEDFERQAQERARKKAAAVAEEAPQTTPKRVARSAPRAASIEAPDADLVALRAFTEQTNERIRRAYEAEARAALLARHIALEIELRARDDEEALIALEIG